MALWLLIAPTDSTFVENDFRIIASIHRVKKIIVPSHDPLSTVYNQLRILLFLMQYTWRANGFYIWFADYHSLLPAMFARLFGKRSLIVVGGYDAASIPQIKYGVFYSRFRGFFAKMSYRLTNCIIPVDESLVESLNTYMGGTPVRHGIKHFVKHLSTRIVTIPTGYDPQRWSRRQNVMRENLVLAVAVATDWRRFELKGFDLLLKIARRMPDVNFMIVGLGGEVFQHVRDEAFPNLELVPFVPNEKLVEYYSKATVFCQFSLCEGLPNTLCESMLCECIPVGSKVGGIPKAIGDCGYILEIKNAAKGAELISQALHANNELGKQARERIVINFGQTNREKKLLALLSERQLG